MTWFYRSWLQSARNDWYWSSIAKEFLRDVISKSSSRRYRAANLDRLTKRLTSKCLTIREDDFRPMVAVAHTLRSRKRAIGGVIYRRERSVVRCAVARRRRFLDRATARSRSRNARASEIRRFRWGDGKPVEPSAMETHWFSTTSKILRSITIFQVVEFTNCCFETRNNLAHAQSMIASKYLTQSVT